MCNALFSDRSIPALPILSFSFLPCSPSHWEWNLLQAVSISILPHCSMVALHSSNINLGKLLSYNLNIIYVISVSLTRCQHVRYIKNILSHPLVFLFPHTPVGNQFIIFWFIFPIFYLGKIKTYII